MKTLTFNRNHMLFIALVATLGISKSWSLTAERQGERTLAQTAAAAPQQQGQAAYRLPTKVVSRYKNKDVEFSVRYETVTVEGETLYVENSNGEFVPTIAPSRRETIAKIACAESGDNKLCIPERRVESLSDWERLLSEHVQNSLSKKASDERAAKQLENDINNCVKSSDGEKISSREEKLQCFADNVNNAEEEKDRKKALERLERELKADIESEDEYTRNTAMEFLKSISSKDYSYNLVQKTWMGIPLRDQMGMPIYELKRKISYQDGFFTDSTLQTHVDKFLLGAAEHEQILDYAKCFGQGVSQPSMPSVHGPVGHIGQPMPIMNSESVSCLAGIKTFAVQYQQNKATHFGGGRSDYEINKEVFPLWRDTNLSLARSALSNSQGVYQKYFGDGIVGDITQLPAEDQINSIIRGQRSPLSDIGLNGVRTLGDLDRQYQDYGYDIAYRGQNSLGQNYRQNNHLNNYQQHNLPTNRGGARAPIYQAPYQQQNYRPPYQSQYQPNYNQNRNPNYRAPGYLPGGIPG